MRISRIAKQDEGLLKAGWEDDLSPASFVGLMRDFAVVSDQIYRRRCVSKRAEKARDLSAMMRAVIDDMQHDLP